MTAPIKQDEYHQMFQSLHEGAQKLRSEALKLRKKKLSAMGKWILAHRSDIEQALLKDMQKPGPEADISEIYPVIAEIRHICRNLEEWAAPEPVPGNLTFLGTSASIHFEPKGTCLIISPWNYPFLLAVGPILSAVAAGNAFILKPSEYTPAINAVIGELVSDLFSDETGLVVEGEADVSAALLQCPFDHVFFTGSPEVGKKVMAAASANLSSVTLELGGKSPTIIDETAKVDDAAKKIAWGKWLNAGQTCLAPDYMLVHESKRESFLKALETQAHFLYGVGKNHTGIINKHHFERLIHAIQDALDQNASLVFGGDSDEQSCRIAPTVIENVTEKMTLMQQEIFGPVLVVMSYQSLDEAISFINSRPKPLALYLFSRSRRVHQRVSKATTAGTMVINDCVLQFGHPNLPFGGVNNSGFGRAHGKAGFRTFSNEKSILKQRVGITAAQMAYPPYSAWKKRAIDFMLRFF